MAQKKKPTENKAAAEEKNTTLSVVKTGTALAESNASEEKTKAPEKKTSGTRGGSKKATGLERLAHIFEIGDDQISTDDVANRIYEDYKAKGHKIGFIKKLDVYYNFEERKAYYVVNDKSEGNFVEF